MDGAEGALKTEIKAEYFDGFINKVSAVHTPYHTLPMWRLKICNLMQIGIGVSWNASLVRVQDIAFLHVPSKTLIEADLLFNLPATEQVCFNSFIPYSLMTEMITWRACHAESWWE